MSQHHISIFSSILLCFALAGCSVFDKRPPTRDEVLQKTKQGKIYFVPYEKVWRAAQVVVRYPLLISNMDTGIIETDYVKAAEGFKPVNATKDPSSGMRYKIRVALAKGKINGKDSVKVTVLKMPEIVRDFVSDPEPLQSDGFEEKVIYYRIDREIAIEEGISKVLGD